MSFPFVSVAGPKVDQLKNEMAAQKRLGINQPFINVDLRNWLPYWAATAFGGDSETRESCLPVCVRCACVFCPCLGEEDCNLSAEVGALCKALSGPPKKKRPLNMAQWQLAMDQFALGAAACQMISFPDLMAHKASDLIY